MNWRGLVSIVETLAFVVAVVFAMLSHMNDAIITALIAAACHGVNHPAGGSEI